MKIRRSIKNLEPAIICSTLRYLSVAFTNSSGVNHSAVTAFATSNDQPSTSLWKGGTNGGMWYLYPFETYKNASTTNPIYIKIVYALSGTGSPVPVFQISIGNAYSTSGTSTGTIGGNQLEAKAISGTEGGISPFLSPDDRWVGFWADGNSKRSPSTAEFPTT